MLASEVLLTGTGAGTNPGLARDGAGTNSQSSSSASAKEGADRVASGQVGFIAQPIGVASGGVGFIAQSIDWRPAGWVS